MAVSPRCKLIATLQWRIQSGVRGFEHHHPPFVRKFYLKDKNNAFWEWTSTPSKPNLMVEHPPPSKIPRSAPVEPEEAMRKWGTAPRSMKTSVQIISWAESHPRLLNTFAAYLILYRVQVLKQTLHQVERYVTRSRRPPHTSCTFSLGFKNRWWELACTKFTGQLLS